MTYWMRFSQPYSDFLLAWNFSSFHPLRFFTFHRKSRREIIFSKEIRWKAFKRLWLICMSELENELVIDKGFVHYESMKFSYLWRIYWSWFGLWQHCSDDDSTTRPLLLVTASVDRIVLKKPISVAADLKIVGSVIWVGRSSIEVQLDMIQSSEGMDYELW